MSILRGKLIALMRKSHGVSGPEVPAGDDPLNTEMPTISNAVIGTPMEVTSYGTWANGPIAAYSVDWQVDGVSKGPDYTPVEADRTKTLTAMVTASNASGDGTAVSAGKTIRRTEPVVAYNYGKLTPNRSGTTYNGTVPIANLSTSPERPLLGPTVDLPDAWTVSAASAGNDAHWLRNPIAGYTPCKVAPIAGDYVFEMVSTWIEDGVSETQTLTITAKDGVLTKSSYDTYDLNGAGAKAILDVNADGNGNGHAVEFAHGSDWSAVRVILGPQNFTNRVTFRHAHEDRLVNRERFATLNCLSLINARLVGINTYNHPYIANGRLYLSSHGNSPTVPSTNVIMENCKHLGDEASMLENGGDKSKGSAYSCLYFALAEDCVSSDHYIEWCGTGISLSKTKNCFVNRPIVNYYFNNACEYGSPNGPNDFWVYDALFMRPWYGGPIYEGLHLDAVQGGDSAYSGDCRFIRLMCVRAGGNRSSQTFFEGSDASGTYMNTEIHGYISTNRGGHALTVTRLDNSVFEYIGILKHDGDTFAATTGAHGSAEWPAISLGNTPPLSRVGNSNATRINGTSIVRKGFTQGTFDVNGATGGISFDADFYSFYQLADYDGLPKTSAPALNAQMHLDPRAYLESIPDSTWRAMSPAQIKAEHFKICRALPGSDIAAVTPVNAAGDNWREELLEL